LALARQRARFGHPGRNRTGQNQRRASVVPPLSSENVGIEWMMEREHAAGKEPRQQRQAQTGERGGRKR
jgi:hypothetical protein